MKTSHPEVLEFISVFSSVGSVWPGERGGTAGRARWSRPRKDNAICSKSQNSPDRRIALIFLASQQQNPNARQLFAWRFTSLQCPQYR